MLVLVPALRAAAEPERWPDKPKDGRERIDLRFPGLLFGAELFVVVWGNVPASEIKG